MRSQAGGFRDSFYLSSRDRVLRGLKRTVVIAAPAVGVDWTARVPPGRQWRIRAIFAQLTTAAAVANRFVGSIVTDGNATVYQVQPTAAQVAGQPGVGYTFVPSSSVTVNTGLSNFNAVPIMDAWLPSGYTIGTVTSGLQAADQWSAINAAVEEAFFDDSLLTTELFNLEDTERAAPAQGR